MANIDLKTKPCPFCAEIIQEAAIKCRFCGEFLNTDKVRTLTAEPEPDSQETEEEPGGDDVLFAARPSLLGLVNTVLKAGMLLVVAALVIKYPIESLINHLPRTNITESQLSTAGHYRVLFGVGICLVIVIGLVFKAVKLKMIYYEVSSDRIEWSRGIFDRKVDNLDMFRVTDLKLRRNLFDYMVGIGRIVLITTDKTDPKFYFEKVRKSRDLYDIIKKASLEADRRTGVVHLE